MRTYIYVIFQVQPDANNRIVYYPNTGVKENNFVKEDKLLHIVI